MFVYMCLDVGEKKGGNSREVRDQVGTLDDLGYGVCGEKCRKLCMEYTLKLINTVGWC